jgi:hypothetical protein
MSNCTGIVYGTVLKSSDRSPIAGVDVSINWVQEAQGGPLRIGGDDSLTTYTPHGTSTKSGKYIVPFFWASEQVPGDTASALAMNWSSDKTTYQALNAHGRVYVTLDVRRLFGIAAPSFPSSGAGGLGLFLKFWQAANEELKGTSILTRFIGSMKFTSAELQGVVIPMDFAL